MGGVTDTELPAAQPVAELGDPDPALAAAVELARSAAVEMSDGDVGEHLGVTAVAERIVTHTFEANKVGYRGWHWSVTLARAPRSKTATVDEVVLLPGDTALLAPPWVPWQERLRKGDLAAGDVMPAVENDPRLVPAYVLSDDPQVEEVAFELGVGRPRVLSRDGRLDAADRWYHGDSGPDTPMAKQAPARCGTCGFFVQLQGSLKGGFGVCANEITETDGHVVSVEFGCGAHSEAGVDVATLVEPIGAVYDDGDVFV
jgi:hypothetical protein